MTKSKLYTLICVGFLLVVGIFLLAQKAKLKEDLFLTHIVDTKKQHVQFFLKDDNGVNFSSIKNLKGWLLKNNRELLFAMNGGMFKPDHSPQGLYIENEVLLSPLDTSNGIGNFYLMPNGIFYLTTNNISFITTTTKFTNSSKIKYATQSGPMLVIDGKIHPAFNPKSANLNIRNGVGILPGNKVVFVMSKHEINFYNFADYFKQLGCKNALYLDGLVSRAFLPEKRWIQTDGDFGVILGVTRQHVN